MTATYARGVIDTVLTEKEVTVTPETEYVDVLGAARMVASDSNERFSAAFLAFIREMARGG